MVSPMKIKLQNKIKLITYAFLFLLEFYVCLVMLTILFLAMATYNLPLFLLFIVLIPPFLRFSGTFLSVIIDMNRRW